MKKFIVFFFVLLCVMPLVAKIDLNTATFEELMQLPITEKQARDILEYREYVSIFKDVYQLREIPSIDQKTLLNLKDLVVVSIYQEEDEALARRQQIQDLL
ncbi:MAG TPA: helix-hairpin-helix domain-containing protein, partial [Candidatus Syntrophosphaera thermopropionivorans]|nr:helix-hairpin-helix domain-containing protein [Candidatus Syntrophosphaera thermopropionivorans]